MKARQLDKTIEIITATVLAALLSSSLATAQMPEEPPNFIEAWSTWEPGNPPRVMTYTSSIGVDSSGNVFVSDVYNYRVHKFDNSGEYLSSWFAPTPAWVSDISVSSSGRVYIVDWSNSLRIYDEEGNFLGQYGEQTYDPGPAEFYAAMGAAFDDEGAVYITDYGSTSNLELGGRVQKFDSEKLETFQGPLLDSFIGQWGSPGTAEGQFQLPHGIAYSTVTNYLYVVDTSNNRVQAFDKLGNFQFSWGSFGSDYGQFYHPRGLTIDAEGNVYVADTWNHRIQKFDGYGCFLSAWGTQGAGEGEFTLPFDVAVDSRGNVFVADTYNSRIQKFGVADRDGDGRSDDDDNCPLDPNPGQEDQDSDGLGDACDPDIDGDGVSNEDDNCMKTPNPGQADQDGDGTGDACDPDLDGDGIENTADNCPSVFNPTQADMDGDGVGNLCDPDVDGDGIYNDIDNCVEIPNADQDDFDGDGVGDTCDPDRDGDGIDNENDACPLEDPGELDINEDGCTDTCQDIAEDMEDTLAAAFDSIPSNLTRRDAKRVWQARRYVLGTECNNGAVDRVRNCKVVSGLTKMLMGIWHLTAVVDYDTRALRASITDYARFAALHAIADAHSNGNPAADLAASILAVGDAWRDEGRYFAAVYKYRRAARVLRISLFLN